MEFIDELAIDLPAITDAESPYWEACRRGKLVLPRCGSCSRFHYYPRAFCPYCSSSDLSWREVSGEGTVYTFSIVHRARSQAFQSKVPYVLAIVELSEGPRMLTNIVGCPVDEVAIGMPVRVAFRHLEDQAVVPVFVKDGKRATGADKAV